MPIIRRKLDMNDVYSTTTRYNAETDTVQSFVDGSWVDNPAADPRKQTLFPPVATSDPACDAAERVKEAFKNTIDETLTLIGESKTFFSVAGAILALFEFGPFGLFIVLAIALANAMLDAGTIALEAALTEPIWEQFKCILDCHMNSSGRVKIGQFGVIESDVSSQIGGLAATVLNAMLQIAGEGGVNNLAALGTATGDCSACECAPCTETWFNSSGYGTSIDPVIEGYVSFQSQIVGTTQICQIQTDDISHCCKILDVVWKQDGVEYTPFAVYHIMCGNALIEDNLVIGTGLNACVNLLASQEHTGDIGSPFTMSVLFEGCP